LLCGPVVQEAVQPGAQDDLRAEVEALRARIARLEQALGLEP
jgi:hypothetical protein